MGMTSNQLNLIRAIAENKLVDVKRFAIACCEEDSTQKNAYEVKRYLNLLNSNPTMIEMPFNIQGMAEMEDSPSVFREDRYYLSQREAQLFEKIRTMNKAGIRLMEMGIPYLNSVLLTGESGTGKTTFGRYVAKKLNLPFLYVNFSFLIDSHIGSTSKNLHNVFNYASLNKCVFMVDEIDCIAQKRKGASEGTSREFNNTTISLLQELDKIRNDTIIIGATNVPQVVDSAVVRRFSIQHEIKPLSMDENIKMVHQYLSTVDIPYDKSSVERAVKIMREKASFKDSKGDVPQAVILNYVVSKIADAIAYEKNCITL